MANLILCAEAEEEGPILHNDAKSLTQSSRSNLPLVCGMCVHENPEKNIMNVYRVGVNPILIISRSKISYITKIKVKEGRHKGQMHKFIKLL